MTSSPHSLPPPTRPSRRPASLAPDLRLAELEQELAATSEPTRQAVLHYELGHISEFLLGQLGPAVQHYLTAFNLDRDFRVALYALLRLFEQRGDHPNLPRLYAAQARGSRTAAERAAAAIDTALAARRDGKPADTVCAHLDAALTEDPSNLEAALLRGALYPEPPTTSAGAMAALACTAHHTDDPRRQALALMELARALADTGQDETARDAALTAVRLSPELESAHALAEALTRRGGPTTQHVDTLTRHARQLGAWRAEEGAHLPQAERDGLAAEAAALWCEAARLGVGPLATPGDALASLKEAAELTPEDIRIPQLRMFAFDLLEDRAAAAAEAERLLARGVTGRDAAGLHFRLAELSLTEGKLAEARAQLRHAMECSGGSRAAQAMLDDLLFDEGLHAERLALLRTAAQDDPRLALEAALVAAHDVGDMAEAGTLFERAAQLPALREAAARERYWATVLHGDADNVRAAIDHLLELDLSASERAALLLHRLEDAGIDGTAVTGALGEAACRPWLPTLVRLLAAEGGDWLHLAEAHLALADHDDNPEERAAHYCAAARAQMRAGQPDAAEKALRKALELDPTQPYPLALLQEALRAGGHEDEVVELLVHTAERQKSSADAELSLLLAGAAAEATGDADRAAAAYREAAERSPGSVGPPWALLQLASRRGDAAMGLAARQALAAREQDQDGAGLETLLLAHEHETRGDTTAAQTALSPVLRHPELAAHAGLSLALLPDATAALRREALTTLSTQDEAAQAAWVRMRERWQPSETAEGRATARASVLSTEARDPWARWSAIREPGVSSSRAAEAARALAEATTDESLREALRAEAVRWLRTGAEQDTAIRPHLAAAGVDDDAEGMGPALARAVLEGSGEGIDPGLRARAFAARRDTSAGDDRADQVRAMARSLARAGEAAEATALLVERLQDAPDDLASWELLRVTARAAGKPEWVAAACDTLAERLTGTLWAELSEEAAAVRMDHLGEDAEAEEILRAVLVRSPERPIAYGRLHDLLSERDDTAGLLELVTERIQAVDQAEELVGLFYEQARLYRAEGDLVGALGALDNLLMLDAEHVAGLALLAEVHTARSDWEGAVGALRDLAQTDIPGAQRKLARLGAADYLEKKLRRPDEALGELLTIETEGLAGPAVYVRMANLYEGLGDLDKCVRALQAAVAEEADARRPALHLRLAKLHQHLGQPGAAITEFSNVLTLVPTHLEAAREKAGLLDDAAEREALLLAFEAAVRDDLFADPAQPEPYRKLRASAALRGDRDLELRTLSCLHVLGALDAAETTALESHPPGSTIDPGAALTDAELASLLSPATDPAYRQLALPLLRATVELDGLEPARFGVGRGQRVSPREAHSLRDELTGMLVALGGELADFYVGGGAPDLVRAAPKGLSTHMIVGVAVTSPLSPARRHEAALQVAAARLGCLPLLERSPEEAAKLFHAGLRAAERPLSPAVESADLADRGRALWKAASRRDRKAIEETAQALDDGGVGARNHVERSMQHVRRLALLLGASLEAALTAVFGEAPNADRIGTSEQARDLIRAWLSPELGELRRKLGMAK